MTAAVREVLLVVALLWTTSVRAAPDIVIAVGSAIDSVDPHRTETFASLAIARALHRGLTAYGPSGSVVAGLAESWEVSETGLEYVFHLRGDARWSDGTPLVAADVVAGLHWALDPGREIPFAPLLYMIDGAEAYRNGTLAEGQALGITAPDRRTVVIRLWRRSQRFLDVLAHPVAAPVPSGRPDAVADGKLTSGAYRLAGRSGEGAELVANETFSPEAAAKALRLVPVSSATAAWNAVTGGTAHLTLDLPMVSTPAVGPYGPWVRADGGDGLYAYAVNTTRKPFHQREVRHALAMAVNRTELLDSLQLRQVRPALNYVPPSAVTFFDPYEAPFEPLDFDMRLAVAGALLSELGHGNDNRIPLMLRIPRGDVHRAVAEFAVRAWQAIGVTVRVVEADLADHWRALAAGDFDLAYVQWPGARNSPRGPLEPLSAAGGPWNFSRYVFDGFEGLLNQADETENPESRAGYYREAERRLIEDQTLIGLFFHRPVVLVSPELEGWQANPLGVHPLRFLSLRDRAVRPSIGMPPVPRAVPSSGEEP